MAEQRFSKRNTLPRREEGREKIKEKWEKGRADGRYFGLHLVAVEIRHKVLLLLLFLFLFPLVCVSACVTLAHLHL